MAVTITFEALAAEIGLSLPDNTTRAARLLAVATEAVNRYAPTAPDAIANEAVIRFAGYLAGSDYGGVKSESIGPRAVEYTPPTNNAAAFRISGAAGLLTVYRVRRAGAI